MRLRPDEKLNIRELLLDLDKYEPKRHGWSWRKGRNNPRKVGDF